MSGVDLFSTLPDHVLQHVLSFLPSRNAVSSSALSRRWRHQWRSSPALRVPGPDASTFINRFLLLRDGVSPLRTLEIDVGHCSNEYDDDDVDMWIRHGALTCQTLAFAASAEQPSEMLRLTRGPLAARHLTTLRLRSVRIDGDFLDLSRCPALLHLCLSKCLLDCKTIASSSLRRLSLADCSFVSSTKTSTRIATPSLRWLHLEGPPRCLLESMPSLTAATVLLLWGKEAKDCGSRSMLLDALSEATTLELMASSSRGQAILQRDLKWCPTFSKLKTLVLNDWCIYDDKSELACLLWHSPVLEKLTFEFSKKPSYELKTKGSYDTVTSEQKTFERLETVEIKCQEVGRRVFKVLRVLSACGVPLAKISIQGSCSQSERFNFACTSFSFIES
ncbi:F-box protein At5g03100-like [Lolium perenne]|uniref:F-box protein At5g03100-like n=1 Tax=Lolium perenne TaxID=4522 RepID=UPI0021F6595B|nr:F-box/LRR-repeat protein At3g26922-like [Lolium perenne]